MQFSRFDDDFRPSERARPKIKDDSELDYKNVEVLKKFLGTQGQILSRRRSGFAAQRQRLLKEAIKRARHLALLPFVD
jgi:small subunit ribosomal protein S18